VIPFVLLQIFVSLQAPAEDLQPHRVSRIKRMAASHPSPESFPRRKSKTSDGKELALFPDLGSREVVWSKASLV
jgi:hypothetical protein